MSESLVFSRSQPSRHRTLTPARRVALLAPSADLDPQGEGEAAATARLALALTAIGHEPHIFAISDSDDPICLGEIPITFCTPRTQVPLLRLGRHWRPGLSHSPSHRLLCSALALAESLQAHESRHPFHLVQSDAESLTGYFVPPVAGRPHLVRCTRSLHDEDFLQDTGSAELHSLREDRRLMHLTWTLMHQADALHAPSRYLADRLANHWRRQVGVVRTGFVPQPAFDSECNLDPTIPQPPHSRFVLHLGPFSRAKGSDLLAQAAKQVVTACPDFQMIWADPQADASSDDHALAAGVPGLHFAQLPTESRIQAVSDLMAQADAVIVPSRHDNLPPVVLQALHQGKPVIGTAGASIDEAVRHRRTGLLVQAEDVTALSQVLIEHWQQPLAFDWSDPNRRLILEETTPAASAAALMRFAASAGRTIRRRVA